MSKFDENLFGRIAVFNNYLSWDQLDECLKLQRSESPPRRLGEILREKGYLTEGQLQSILEVRRNKVRMLLRDPRDLREQDRRFGELAVRAGLISVGDLESAILEQERLSRLNFQFRLGEVLVAGSVMDVTDVREVLRYQGRRIMVCPVCDCHFNVSGSEEGPCHCLKCQEELQEPSFLDTVVVDAFIESDRSRRQGTAEKSEQAHDG